MALLTRLEDRFLSAAEARAVVVDPPRPFNDESEDEVDDGGSGGTDDDADDTRVPSM